MTTHRWLDNGWCPLCGALKLKGAEPMHFEYLAIGSPEPRAEEPPCAGWVWTELDEIDAPHIVAAVRAHVKVPDEVVRASVFSQRRWQLLSTTLDEMSRGCFLPKQALLLPGMSAPEVIIEDGPRVARVSWLARRLGPEQTLRYLANLRQGSVEEKRLSQHPHIQGFVSQLLAAARKGSE